MRKPKIINFKSPVRIVTSVALAFAMVMAVNTFAAGNNYTIYRDQSLVYKNGSGDHVRVLCLAGGLKRANENNTIKPGERYKDSEVKGGIRVTCSKKKRGKPSKPRQYNGEQVLIRAL